MSRTCLLYLLPRTVNLLTPFKNRIHWSLLALVALVAVMLKAEYDANMAHKTLAFALVANVPAGDKIGHFCLFGGLAFLVDRLWRRRDLSAGRLRVPAAAVVVLGLATLEELAQAFHPHRTLDIVDWLANLAGVTAFIWVGRTVDARARQAASERPGGTSHDPT